MIKEGEDMIILQVTQHDLHYAKKAKALFFNDEKKTHINDAFFQDERNKMFVAIENEDVIGMLYGYELERFDRTAKQLFLYSIDVAQGNRRKGVGKRLVDAFLEPLKDNLYESAFVLTNEHNIAAMRLYASTGAKQITSMDGANILFEWSNDVK